MIDPNSIPDILDRIDACLKRKAEIEIGHWWNMAEEAADEIRQQRDRRAARFPEKSIDTAKVRKLVHEYTLKNEIFADVSVMDMLDEIDSLREDRNELVKTCDNYALTIQQLALKPITDMHERRLEDLKRLAALVEEIIAKHKQNGGESHE